MEEVAKTINITGTNNRYHMKKLIHKEKKEPKKRVVAEKWCFSEEYFEYTHQLKLVNDIFNNVNNFKNINNIDNINTIIDASMNNDINNNVIKIIIQQINKKISGYKQQDIMKKKLDTCKFITFESIIKKIVDCELNCRYCKEHMNVLYDISREMKQWSVDRINNDLGHNIDNFHIACLDCNLKRRRKTDEKFLFTKQLQIVKQDS
jgi:hypothetical protein